MPRTATVIVVLTQLAAVSGCGGGPSGAPPAGSREVSHDQAIERPASPVMHAATPAGDASTNLDTTPLSAADYALYSNMMGGASALLSTLGPADREALEFARKVDAGQAKVTPATEKLLAEAQALRRKDEELARMQGVGDRYLKVKASVEAVVGRHAHPPAADDPVATENRRFLQPHRESIERLQAILHDPLSRPEAPGVGEPPVSRQER